MSWYPFGGSVAIYSADSAPVILNRPDVVYGAGPVAGFQLKTARLWARE